MTQDSATTRPTITTVLPLVLRLYREEDPCSLNAGGVGGHMHIVLDDGNVERSNVEFCINAARKDHCTTCLTIGELMLRMSPTQRAKLSRFRVVVGGVLHP